MDAGFKKIMVHPAPVRGLDRFSVDREMGDRKLVVGWEKSGNRIVFDLTVPDGTEVIWMPQLLRPDQLENILGPDGRLTTSDKAQIIFNDPGQFKITYNL